MKPLAVAILIVVVALVFWYFRNVQSPTPMVSQSVSPSSSAVIPSPSKTSRPVASITPTASHSPSVSVSPTYSISPSPTSTTSPVAGKQTYVVVVQDIVFTPSQLTVKKGDLVIFHNGGTLTQTATAINRAFDSHSIRSGEDWTLDTSTLAVGTYDYNSTLHPSARGTLIVN